MNAFRVIFFPSLQRLVSPVLILHTRETEQMTECKEGAALHVRLDSPLGQITGERINYSTNDAANE